MDIAQNNIDQQENGRLKHDVLRLETQDTTQRYEVLQQLGDCHTSVDDYEQAQQYYEKAARLSPDEAGPYIGLGVIALRKNLLDDAKIAFRVACRLAPDCSRAYVGLAMVAQQDGDYKSAFDMYLKSLELDTDNLTALLGLFQASCRMGSFAKVTHYLEAYLNMHPGDISVMFSLAALYVKDSRTELARKTLSDVLAIEPSNKDAANLLEEVEHKLAQKESLE